MLKVTKFKIPFDAFQKSRNPLHLWWLGSSRVSCGWRWGGICRKQAQKSIPTFKERRKYLSSNNFTISQPDTVFVHWLWFKPWQQCILAGLHFARSDQPRETPITHQPIDRLKKREQIRIWDIKNCQCKVKWHNNNPTISSFSEHASDEVCDFTLFWRECILHGPTSLRKTPITHQPIDRLKKRDQIWIWDTKNCQSKVK